MRDPERYQEHKKSSPRYSLLSFIIFAVVLLHPPLHYFQLIGQPRSFVVRTSESRVNAPSGLSFLSFFNFNFHFFSRFFSPFFSTQTSPTQILFFRAPSASNRAARLPCRWEVCDVGSLRISNGSEQVAKRSRINYETLRNERIGSTETR